MIVEFHDQQGQRLHDKFQDWRREHQIQQDACFLSFSSKNNAQLHTACACWHIGGFDWDGHRVRGGKENIASLTKNRKICADSQGELLSWADNEGVSVKYCSHCYKPFSDSELATFDAPADTPPSELDDSVLAKDTALVVDARAGMNDVNDEAQLAHQSEPIGNRNPQTTATEVMQIQRDALVRAWVLQQANGKCESCEKPSPFNGTDGLPYLEVHHVRHMADNGSDTPANAVALCPNCHRELHYGVNAKTMVTRLYERVARLVRE